MAASPISLESRVETSKRRGTEDHQKVLFVSRFVDIHSTTIRLVQHSIYVPLKILFQKHTSPHIWECEIEYRLFPRILSTRNGKILAGTPAWRPMETDENQLENDGFLLTAIRRTIG